MKTIKNRNIGEPQPQLGPIGPPQIIGGPCLENQAHLNGRCRDIPGVGLTKCGVVNIKNNQYMLYTDEEAPPEDPQPTAGTENVGQGGRRRRSLRGGDFASLTRIIGGEDSVDNTWPWQVSITTNDPKDETSKFKQRVYNFFSSSFFIQIFLLATKVIHLFFQALLRRLNNTLKICSERSSLF